MFSRAGYDEDQLVWLLVAQLGGHVAHLVYFERAGDFAWWFPKYDCFRWAGGWRPRSLIDPLKSPPWSRPQSLLPLMSYP